MAQSVGQKIVMDTLKRELQKSISIYQFKLISGCAPEDPEMMKLEGDIRFLRDREQSYRVAYGLDQQT